VIANFYVSNADCPLPCNLSSTLLIFPLFKLNHKKVIAKAKKFNRKAQLLNNFFLIIHNNCKAAKNINNLSAGGKKTLK
jgi:hypothetical protein